MLLFILQTNASILVKTLVIGRTRGDNLVMLRTFLKLKETQVGECRIKSGK